MFSNSWCFKIFLYDPEDAISQIRQHPSGYVLPSILNVVLLQQLLEVLHEHNLYIHIYRTAHERLQQAIQTLPANEVRLLLNPQMELVLDQGRDSRRYNIPTFNEVAIIILDEYSLASHCDIILAQRNVPNQDQDQFRIISSSHAAYTPLHYVLFFPLGDHGWNWSLCLQQSRNADGIPKQLSQRQYYQFRLHSRLFEPATLFQGG